MIQFETIASVGTDFIHFFYNALLGLYDILLIFQDGDVEKRSDPEEIEEVYEEESEEPELSEEVKMKKKSVFLRSLMLSYQK